jgi:hypothetical protein
MVTDAGKYSTERHIGRFFNVFDNLANRWATNGNAFTRFIGKWWLYRDNRSPGELTKPAMFVDQNQILDGPKSLILHNPWNFLGK